MFTAFFKVKKAQMIAYAKYVRANIYSDLTSDIAPTEAAQEEPALYMYCNLAYVLIYHFNLQATWQNLLNEQLHRS